MNEWEKTARRYKATEPKSIQKSNLNSLPVSLYWNIKIRILQREIGLGLKLKWAEGIKVTKSGNEDNGGDNNDDSEDQHDGNQRLGGEENGDKDEDDDDHDDENMSDEDEESPYWIWTSHILLEFRIRESCFFLEGAGLLCMIMC